MRKFLFFLMLLSTVVLSEETDPRSKFLLAYYDGDYEKAHQVLKTTFNDPTTVQIWEERLHQHKSIPNCDFASHSTPATQGMADLRIGHFKGAETKFQSDWLSLLGRATLELYANRADDSWKHIQEALAANPQRPELLFFAACLTTNTQISNEYFRKFLAVPSEDPMKQTTAEFSIDFNTKTEGMQLNAISVSSSPQKIDSYFRDARPVIKGILNQKEKLTLLLDTGAGGFTLEKKDWQPKISSDLIMTGFGKNQVTKAVRSVFDVFTSPGIVVKNPVAAISPSFQSAGINGIAPTALFGNYLILLPMKADKQVVLFSPRDEDALQTIEKAGYHFNSKIILPFQLVNRMIILKGRIKKSGEDMDILLDTGAQQSVLSAATAHEFAHISVDSIRNGASVSGIGGTTKAMIAENVDFSMGEIKGSFQRMLAINLADISEALELEIDMILGRDFLNGYTLLIDYPHSKVTFLK